MTSSASTCSRIFMTPIWLAISVPALAEIIAAVMIGASSLTPASETNIPTSRCPPSGLKALYPWSARLVPTKAAMIKRMGRLLMPILKASASVCPVGGPCDASARQKSRTHSP